MNERKKKIGTIVLISLVVFIGTYKLIIANQIRSFFQDQGFENIELYVESVGSESTVLKDVFIGDINPIEIGEVKIDYSISDLFNKKLKHIELQKVNIEAEIVHNKLMVYGFDGMIHDFSPQEIANIFPNSFFNSDAFFFNSLSVRKGVLHFNKSGVDISIPFNLDIVKNQDIMITFDMNNISGKAYDYVLTGDKTEGSLKLENNKEWQGQWESTILVKNKNLKALPKVVASGNITFTKNRLKSQFKIDSVPSVLKLDADLELLKQNSYISFNELKIPFADGTVGFKRLTIPFNIKNTIHFNLECNNLSTEQVLSMIFGGSVVATGQLSGNLPMAITQAGTLIFYQASLNSEDNAKISIPAELIPEKNKDVANIRKYMNNFEYDRLAVELESEEKDDIAFNLVFLGQQNSPNKKAPDAINIRLDSNLTKLLEKTELMMNLSNSPATAKPVQKQPQNR